MTFLVERLADLRLHIGHLRAIKPRVDVLVHEDVALDYALVLDALDGLDAVERFVTVVARLEGEA